MQDGSSRHRGSGIASDQGVGGRSRQSQQPGHDVPHNRPQQPRHHYILRNNVEPDHAAADGLGYRGAQYEGGEKVEMLPPTPQPAWATARASKPPSQCCWPRREIRSENRTTSAVITVMTSKTSPVLTRACPRLDSRSNAHLGRLKRSSERRFPARWPHLRPCRWLLPGSPAVPST